MKLFKLAAWILALGTGSILVGCSQPVSSGGSVVGNGMNHYQNPEIGIAFDYPHDWKLTESASRTAVSIDNAGAAKERSGASRIEFSLEPSLEGERFTSAAALGEALKNRWPARDWNAIQFAGGQNGFFAREIQGGREAASYYLLDQNRNILFVSYDATVELGGTGVVRKIVSALSIDFEAPLIKRIFFEPAEAAPGQKVKVVIEGFDLISAVAAASLELSFLSAGQDPSVFSSWRRYGLAPPKWDGGIRYESEFQVPQYSPTGEIAVTHASLSDSKENEARGSAGWDMNTPAGRYYHFTGSFHMDGHGQGTKLSPLQEKLSLPKLLVRPGPGALEDSEAPVIQRAWFERSLVTESARTQKLFLEITDQSRLRSSVHFDLSSPLCMKTSTDLVAEGGDLYSVTIDTDQCFKENCRDASSCLLEVGKTRNIALEEAWIFDDVGNPSFGAVDRLPLRVGFMIYR